VSNKTKVQYLGTAYCSGKSKVGLFIASKLVSSEIKPFTSDGCSAFPNGTLEQNQLWLHCCSAHDFAYWKGGSYEQREAADQKLKSCVADVFVLAARRFCLRHFAGAMAGLILSFMAN